MRRLMMLCSLGIGILLALNVEAGSSPTEAECAKIVADAVAALAKAPQNACLEGFAYIPAGPFVMGSSTGGENELPVRTVNTDAYCMAIHETTNAEYQKVMMIVPVAMPKGYVGKGEIKEDIKIPQQPFVMVDWMQADVYCKKVGGRLPTEAEWEKAARGPHGLEYGTQSGTLSKKEAHYDGKTFTDVCSYPKNAYGLCDMTGNVWEWANDWYAKDAYKQMKSQNPQGPKGGEFKVLRGGSWLDSNPAHLRAALRNNRAPAFQHLFVGFRCVVAPKDSK